MAQSTSPKTPDASSSAPTCEPTHCPICCDPITDRVLTSPCFHHFCFGCLTIQLSSNDYKCRACGNTITTYYQLWQYPEQEDAVQNWSSFPVNFTWMTKEQVNREFEEVGKQAFMDQYNFDIRLKNAFKELKNGLVDKERQKKDRVLAKEANKKTAEIDFLVNNINQELGFMNEVVCRQRKKH